MRLLSHKVVGADTTHGYNRECEEELCRKVLYYKDVKEAVRELKDRVMGECCLSIPCSEHDGLLSLLNITYGFL